MAAIGYDLDGVIIDWLGAVHTQVGYESGVDVFSQVVKWYSDGLGYILDAYIDDAMFYQALTPIAGAVDAIMHLAERFDNFYYVTGRPNKLRKITQWWLHRWRLPEAPLIFPRGSKAVTAKRLGLTHFVDDKPQTVKELREMGIDAYLLMVYDTPMRDRHSRLPYCLTTWGKVLQRLEDVKDPFFCKYIRPFSLERGGNSK